MLKWLPALLLFTTTLLGGCSKQDDTITLQLNWKPEPQFGGFYAADYAKHGLKVDVTPGGASAPTIELLGAGKVAFAVVSGDEIPKAREQGIKVIALFAVYQTHPQGIITPARRGFRNIEDVFKSPGTLAMEKGLPYSDFLKKKYGFDRLKIVPSPFGDLSVLRTDPNYAMQCFVTSEPLAAKKAGLDVSTFLIADSGYNPYATVLATTEDVLKSRPAVVRSMIEAVGEGWGEYLKDASPTNAKMHALNPTMDADTFAASAAAQVPLITAAGADLPAAGDVRDHGLGSMTAARWTTLLDQLRDLKVIGPTVATHDREAAVDRHGQGLKDNAIAATDCYNNKALTAVAQ